MRKVTIFFQIFLLLVEINFSSKIEGSQVSEKKPVGHLIKTHSDKFLLQQSGKKKTEKYKEKKDEKKKKMQKGKKAGREDGRQEDYNILCMIGLCGGGGGGSQVGLSQLLNGKSHGGQKYVKRARAIFLKLELLHYFAKSIVLISADKNLIRPSLGRQTCPTQRPGRTKPGTPTWWRLRGWWRSRGWWWSFWSGPENVGRVDGGRKETCKYCQSWKYSNCTCKSK